MFTPDHFLVERMAKQHIDDRLKEAQKNHLLRQAGLKQQSRLSRQTYWLLSRLGHLLVVLGRRLERYGISPVAPAVERPLTNRVCPGR